MKNNNHEKIIPLFPFFFRLACRAEIRGSRTESIELFASVNVFLLPNLAITRHLVFFHLCYILWTEVKKNNLKNSSIFDGLLWFFSTPHPIDSVGFGLTAFDGMENKNRARNDRI